MKNDTLEYLSRVCTDLVVVAEAIRKDGDVVIGSGDHVEIIKHFNHVRLAAERIKEAREALSDMSDSLSRVVIPDLVTNLRNTTGEKPPFNIEGVGRVSVSYRYSCTMLDKAVGVQWLKDHEQGGIVQETVNAQTLAAFAKDLLENQGKELPPDIFKVGTSPFTSITKK